MNLFNRIFVVLTSLCVGIAAAVLLLVASAAVEAREVISSGWFYWRLQDLQNVTGTKETLAIIGLAAAVAAATLLILVEYVTLALGRGSLTATGEHNGRSKISTGNVERIVEEAAREVPGVSKVRPDVRRKGDGIVASCRASLEPGVMISDVAPQIEGKNPQRRGERYWAHSQCGEVESGGNARERAGSGRGDEQRIEIEVASSKRSTLPPSREHLGRGACSCATYCTKRDGTTGMTPSQLYRTAAPAAPRISSITRGPSFYRAPCQTPICCRTISW